MTYTPDKRPIQSIGILSNNSATPLGMPPWWHPDFAGTVDEIVTQLTFHLPRVMDGVQSNDRDRVLFWQAGGQGSGSAFLTSAVYHILGPKQQAALPIALAKWRAVRPNRQVIFYGGWGGDPFRREIDMYTCSSEPDWLAELVPMMQAGVNGWGLDAAFGATAAGAKYWPEAKKAQTLLHSYGLFVIGEAAPVVQSASGAWVPDLVMMKAMPSVTWAGNFFSNAVYKDWKKWPPLPADVEAHILAAAPMTKADADLATSLGWIVGQDNVWPYKFP